MKGLNLMYSYKHRKYAVLVSGLGLAGMIGERIAPFQLFGRMTPEQHYYLFLWLTLGGLLMMCFCKERYDDERAKAIRLKAMQLSFFLVMSSMLAFALTMSTAGKGAETETVEGPLLFLFPGFGILAYLLIYYVGIYFDQFWDFEDKERSYWQHIKAIPKNIAGILVYLLVTTVALVVIMLVWS